MQEDKRERALGGINELVRRKKVSPSAGLGMEVGWAGSVVTGPSTNKHFQLWREHSVQSAVEFGFCQSFICLSLFSSVGDQVQSFTHGKHTSTHHWATPQLHRQLLNIRASTCWCNAVIEKKWQMHACRPGLSMPVWKAHTPTFSSQGKGFLVEAEQALFFIGYCRLECDT